MRGPSGPVCFEQHCQGLHRRPAAANIKISFIASSHHVRHMLPVLPQFAAVELLRRLRVWSFTFFMHDLHNRTLILPI